MTNSQRKPQNSALEHSVQEPLRSPSDPLRLTPAARHESPTEDAREDTYVSHDAALLVTVPVTPFLSIF